MGTKNILILSNTKVEHEPRVIRQYVSLSKNGYNVIVSGKVDNLASKTFNNNVIEFPDFSLLSLKFDNLKKLNFFYDLLTFLKHRKSALIISLFKRFYFLIFDFLFKIILFVTSRSNLEAIQKKIIFYYMNFGKWSSKKAFEEIDKNLLIQNFDNLAMVIAHDYHTAFIAINFQIKYACRIVVDVHEEPFTQYIFNEKWVANEQKFMKAVFAVILDKSEIIICVSENIVRKLRSIFPENSNKLRLVRSVPFSYQLKEKKNFYKTNNKIRIIYSGNIKPVRNLEIAVKLLKYLPKNYELTLMGFSDPSYKSTLGNLAQSIGVVDRLIFKDPVNFNQIIPVLSEYSIGYIVLENFGDQTNFCLPNKFFEYLMAGLCIVTNELVEMAKIVREYQCGVVVSTPEPFMLAETISSISHRQLMNFQSNAISASKIFNWENEESSFLISINESLVNKS